MKKTIQVGGVFTAGKAAYKRPAVQVCELKVEGAILLASGEASPSDYEYDPKGNWE